MTLGEKIVRTEFNPSEASGVDYFKQEFAKLINSIDEVKELESRLAYLAITKLEEAAMFAVKLITTKK